MLVSLTPGENEAERGQGQVRKLGQNTWGRGGSGQGPREAGEKATAHPQEV